MGSVAAERKSIIVTGGASGIGLGITKSFAEQGAHISVLDVNPDGASIVEGLKSEYPAASFSFTKCDVSNWNEMAATFKAIYQSQGHIDVVMANAGISREGSLIVDEDEPSQPGLKTLEVNLIGAIYSVKLAIHYLRKNAVKDSSRGTIICTASNAGIYPFPVAPIYGSSKSGVIGLVRSLAKPLEKHSIQIHALAPAVLGNMIPIKLTNYGSQGIAETNIAPSKDLFKPMIITPMSTLTNGVQSLISDPSLTGHISEVHGQSFTNREPPEYVDEDSRKNLETFWNLGYA